MLDKYWELRRILRSEPIEDLHRIIVYSIAQLRKETPLDATLIIEVEKIYLGILKTRNVEINSTEVIQRLINFFDQDWLMNFLVFPALQRYALKLSNINDTHVDNSEIKKCNEINNRMFLLFQKLNKCFNKVLNIGDIILSTHESIKKLNQQIKQISSEAKIIKEFEKKYMATLIEFQDKFIKLFLENQNDEQSDKFLPWINLAAALINEFKEAIDYEIVETIDELVTPDLLQEKIQSIEKQLSDLKNLVSERKSLEATKHIIQLITNIIETDDLGAFCALILKNYEINKKALSKLRRVSYVHNAIAQPANITYYCGDGDSTDYPPYQLVLPLSILKKPYQEISAGDFHGNFEGVMETLQYFFESQKNTYLTIRGDLIDRDMDPQYTNSLRILIALFLTKVLYPNRVFYVPGNHDLSLVSLDDGMNNFYRRSIRGSPITFDENALDIPSRQLHDYYLPIFPIFTACQSPDKALLIQELIHTLFLTAPIEIRVPYGVEQNGTVVYSCTSHSTPCLLPIDPSYYNLGVPMEDYLDRSYITWSDWGGGLGRDDTYAELLELDQNLRGRGGIAGYHTAELLCTRCNVYRQKLGHGHVSLEKSINVNGRILTVNYLSSFYPYESDEEEIFPQITKETYQDSKLEIEYITLTKNTPVEPIVSDTDTKSIERIEIYLKSAMTFKQLTEMYSWVLRSQLLAMTISKKAKYEMDTCLKSLIQAFQYYANIARDNFSYPLNFDYETLNENCDNNQHLNTLQNESIRTAFIDFLKSMAQLLKTGKNQIESEMLKLQQYVTWAVKIETDDSEARSMIQRLQEQLDLEEKVSFSQYEELISVIIQFILSSDIKAALDKHKQDYLNKIVQITNELNALKQNLDDLQNNIKPLTQVRFWQKDYVYENFNNRFEEIKTQYKTLIEQASNFIGTNTKHLDESGILTDVIYEVSAMVEQIQNFLKSYTSKNSTEQCNNISKPGFQCSN